MGAGKNKVSNRVNYNTVKLYKEFIKKHPDKNISKEQFLSIINESNKKIQEYILDNPLGFKLPYDLGYIAVDKFKGLKHYIAVDWVSTRKLGKIIPLTNLHSFGHYYKIKLYKNTKKLPFLGYKMDAHRVVKRRLASIIKNGESKHISIDKSYFANRLKFNQKLNIKEGG